MSSWLVSLALFGVAGAAIPDLSGPPDWEWHSNNVDAFAGTELSDIGDVNGDGFDDVAAVIDLLPPTVGIFHGSPSGLEYFPNATITWGTASGSDDIDIAGGDLDGDGFGDLIIGSGYEGGSNRGAVGVWFGAPNGLWPLQGWVYAGTQTGALLGWGVAAADVNGDGIDDLIVGAPGYDDGQLDEGVFLLFVGSSVGPGSTPTMIEGSDVVEAFFGWGVAGIGDVNGDGYEDIAVESDYFTNGSTNEGRLWVYHGRATGLRPSPSKVWEPDQTIAFLGEINDHPADGGDFNHDGYSDLLVGVQWYDNGEDNEGRALVFDGSVGGLETNPSWIAEGNQVSAQLGETVASVGDVDGDGYDDAVVAVPGFDYTTTAGSVRLYRGGPTGLSLYPDAVAYGAPGDRLGSVTGVGDVNGDGANDLVAGAPFADLGEFNEGRLVAWLGIPPVEESVEPIGGPGEMGAGLEGDPRDPAGCSTVPGAFGLIGLLPALFLRRRR